jgi:hypothetical protein
MAKAIGRSCPASGPVVDPECHLRELACPVVDPEYHRREPACPVEDPEALEGSLSKGRRLEGLSHNLLPLPLFLSSAETLQVCVATANLAFICKKYELHLA